MSSQPNKRGRRSRKSETNKTSLGREVDDELAFGGRLALIREAIAAVPSVKYALGVVGVAAAAVLIRGFFANAVVACISVVGMLVFMVLLVLFARFASSTKGWYVPAQCLVWVIVLCCVLTASCLFFDWPRPLAELLKAGNEERGLTSMSPSAFREIEARMNQVGVFREFTIRGPSDLEELERFMSNFMEVKGQINLMPALFLVKFVLPLGQEAFLDSVTPMDVVSQARGYMVERKLPLKLSVAPAGVIKVTKGATFRVPMPTGSTN
jgi:hypothetical protein